MPLAIRDEGQDNIVDIDEAVADHIDGTVTLRGSGNRVSIRAPLSAHDLQVDLADGSSLSIDGGCFAGNLVVFARKGGHVAIGRGSSFNGLTRLLLHEPGSLTVGQGCLFGPDIDVVNSDMHAIVDVDSGERVNPPKDVAIGDRVWIGIKTFVGKGSTIGDGSVIGAYSFVSGDIPSQCLAIGVPARPKREGVSWRFELD